MKHVFVAVAIFCAGAAGAQGTRHDTAWINANIRFDLSLSNGLALKEPHADLRLSFTSEDQDLTADFELPQSAMSRHNGSVSYTFSITEEDRPRLARFRERGFRLSNIAPAFHLCRTPDAGPQTIAYEIYTPTWGMRHARNMGPEQVALILPKMDPCPTPR